MMQAREEEIAKLIDALSKRTDGFEDPKIILIGGYALRAFVPYSRATRDSDFVLQKRNGWTVDRVKRWKLGGFDIDAFEKRETYAFLKLIKRLTVARRSAQVSVDFMEGEVRGRTDNQVVLIDADFVSESKKVKITIAGMEFAVFVPTYSDYLILKIVSSRPSDIRDVATLVWKNGLPSKLTDRVKQIVPHAGVISNNIRNMVLPVMSDKRFVHSWRGTFATTDFDDAERQITIERLKQLERIATSSLP
jgi:hypothetical protein